MQRLLSIALSCLFAVTLTAQKSLFLETDSSYSAYQSNWCVSGSVNNHYSLQSTPNNAWSISTWIKANQAGQTTQWIVNKDMWWGQGYALFINSSGELSSGFRCLEEEVEYIRSGG